MRERKKPLFLPPVDLEKNTSEPFYTGLNFVILDKTYF